MIELRKSLRIFPARLGKRHRVRGFTMVELIITMVVAAVLLIIAVPSFKRITVTNKLTTAANDIVGSINLARMEAVKRNSSTQLCSDSSTSNTTSDALGTACGTQTGAVYALSGVAAGTAAAAVPVRAAVTGIAAPIVLTGDLVAIRFSSQGIGHLVTDTTPYTGPVADVSTTSISTDNHRCIRMTAGSILTVTTQSTACATT